MASYQPAVDLQIIANTKILERKLWVIGKYLLAIAEELSEIDAEDTVDSPPGGMPER